MYRLSVCEVVKECKKIQKVFNIKSEKFFAKITEGLYKRFSVIKITEGLYIKTFCIYIQKVFNIALAKFEKFESKKRKETERGRASERERGAGWCDLGAGFRNANATQTQGLGWNFKNECQFSKLSANYKRRS